MSFSADTSVLQRCRHFRPQLVIVDMMIPGNGGYRVIEELRSQVPGKLPILAITAAAMTGDEKKVLETGATDTLSKPYAVAELQTKLKKLGK